MSTLVEKYLQHASKAEDYLRHDSVRERFFLLPVCPKCERIAFRDRRKDDPQGGLPYITCPICGFHGPTTIAAKQFIQDHVLRKADR